MQAQIFAEAGKGFVGAIVVVEHITTETAEVVDDVHYLTHV